MKSQTKLECKKHIFLEGLHDDLSHFDCSHHGQRCITGDKFLLNDDPFKDDVRRLLLTLRRDTCDYYGRELSFKEDTLHAVQGIFNFYQNSGALKGKLNQFWGLNFFSVIALDELTSFIANLQWRLIPERGPSKQSTGIQLQPWANSCLFPSCSWAATMANIEAEIRPRLSPETYALRWRHFSLILKRCEEIRISFSHKFGSRVDIQNYMLASEDYLSFHPWLDVTCMSIWCKIADIVPLDPYEAFQHTYHDRSLQSLYFDYRCDWAHGSKSVFAIFLGAWEPCREPNDDHYSHQLLFSDTICLLVEKVADGIFRRIGLWKGSVPKSCQDAPNEEILENILKMGTIESDERWEKRTLRLI
ncbi:hypothetical protein BU23DRAFT_115663 [Bimuria novae-zelandiae CBS 107.79]|uniref:Heterokaryon incompatibility domain-containing protein n=1 Tax=Bimuria novae-zelandiae CBS 107.79 TaxID=1447943 RepID=A0A6A5VCC9_9PLEO|nr:hypothetical protein BU23DRAFT_115663 [Bimuria novae-zelandiae CBS 107.79]